VNHSAVKPVARTTRQAMFETGAAGYLSKPFSVLALTALLAVREDRAHALPWSPGEA
jgi:hypothetical protein